MGRREDALKALESRDWTGATVEHEPRPAMVVHSVRLPADVAAWVAEQADRLDITPSAVIRDVVESAVRGSGQPTVVVDLDALHRGVAQAVDRATLPVSGERAA